MKCFKLVLEYDGAGFHGWQRQVRQRTVQGELEKALAVMTRQRLCVAGSGRTDAGVHALGQVAAFCCDTRLSAGDFFRGLNSLLPPDVVLLSCQEAEPGFHPRKSAKRKTYQYHILNQSLASAVFRNYAWHVAKPLDICAMRLAAEYFLGKHDFAALEGAGSPRKSTVRQISAAHLHKAGNTVIYTVSGNGFLRYMVRNMVGLLVSVGLGKHRPEDVPEILASGDRSQAPPTAPPHGLYLLAVHYDRALSRGGIF